MVLKEYVRNALFWSSTSTCTYVLKRWPQYCFCFSSSVSLCEHETRLISTVVPTVIRLTPYYTIINMEITAELLCSENSTPTWFRLIFDDRLAYTWKVLKKSSWKRRYSWEYIRFGRFLLLYWHTTMPVRHVCSISSFPSTVSKLHT